MTATFLYFAYGSNLGRRRLCAAHRAPSAVFESVGWLDGFRLSFDKYGPSASGDSGKCDCHRTGIGTDRIYGALYRVALAERDALDAVEGLGISYKRVEREVQSAVGPRTASTYLALRKRAGLLPFHWYKQHVLVGAQEVGLPAAYVEAIRTQPSVDDPDLARNAREMAIYR